jgi:hypothetical protein
VLVLPPKLLELLEPPLEALLEAEEALEALLPLLPLDECGGLCGLPPEEPPDEELLLALDALEALLAELLEAELPDEVEETPPVDVEVEAVKKAFPLLPPKKPPLKKPPPPNPPP